VNTTMEVWQGTTMGCVQCHSHPYDPIRHEEYYQLFAFFDNTVDGDRKDDSPRMPLYAPEQRERVARLLSQLDSIGVNTAPEAEALAVRVEQVVHPSGWIPAADFVESEGITSTGDYISPLDDGGWARYQAFDLDDVAGIELGYSGRDGAVEIHLESAGGPLLGRAELPSRPPA